MYVCVGGGGGGVDRHWIMDLECASRSHVCIDVYIVNIGEIDQFVVFLC